MALMTAEIRKLTTVRTSWVLTIVGLLLIAGIAALTVFVDMTGQGGGASFDGSDGDVASLVGVVWSFYVIVLVVGILAMTTEFRHGTIGRTLQLTPSRAQVLTSKMVTGVLYALVFFALGLVVVAIFAAIGSGGSFEVAGETWRSTWQVAVALAGTGLLGVAFGGLVRSQVVAITIALVWTQVLEPLVAVLYAPVGRWLPFQLLNSVFVDSDMGGDVPEAFLNPVDTAIALPVFLAFVLATAIGAGLLMRYRDV